MNKEQKAAKAAYAVKYTEKNRTALNAYKKEWARRNRRRLQTRGVIETVQKVGVIGKRKMPVMNKNQDDLVMDLDALKEIKDKYGV